MPRAVRRTLSCPQLASYFRDAFRPRAEWLVGIEVETMALDAATSRPVPYDAPGASVRRLIEAYAARRGGALVHEGDRPIGIDGSWGGISLEPGGQFEWSARPTTSLDELAVELDAHLAAIRALEAEVGVRWLDVAVQPDAPVGEMPWMPKARYGIMREIMARKGRLAHRMMTQTASIQCAFDYASDDDWSRKFRAAALLAPVAVALFANSSRVDGAASGWASYRQAIWRETDPDRCDLPDVVFDPAFGIDAWVEWACDVPTLFLKRGKGLIPSSGEPFRALMNRAGCDGVTMEDWELHLSSIFTEVRSYSYIEVRSADLQPAPLVLAVPALWTGLLYDDGALDEALALGRVFDHPAAWRRGMDAAARSGLRGAPDGVALASLAARAVALAAGAARSEAGAAALARLARAKELEKVPR
ncbi:MAG TPA: glutamate-cysteine ligase family protein [Candidatus Polarisedimenticolaceae bacterium]|nr:glutamate-cysteine ligase family protein [Candidatus Polarisedimenticolaceae bacterium]